MIQKALPTTLRFDGKEVLDGQAHLDYDDEPPIVESVGYNLKQEGYEVIPAKDGEVGLELALAQEVEINLLDNAFKYTPPEGQVQMAVRPVGEGLEVSVADTGIGILAAPAWDYQLTKILWKPMAAGSGR